MRGPRWNSDQDRRPDGVVPGTGKEKPARAARALLRLRRGRAGFKQEIADQIDLDAAVLPYDDEIIAYLREERAGGRRIVLTTATNEKYARQIADHVGLFDEVLASDAKTNLSGEQKLNCLRERFGSRNFDYVGNSHADCGYGRRQGTRCWFRPERGVETRAARSSQVTRVFRARRNGASVFLRAIRMHQWLKNLLLFVPLIAAHRIAEVELLETALLAFFSFSLCASSAYVANDLFDLRADRRRQKRYRPFASGSLSVKQGLFLSLSLLAGRLGLGALVSTPFPGHRRPLLCSHSNVLAIDQESRGGGHSVPGRPVHSPHHSGRSRGANRPVVLAAGVLDVHLPEHCDREALFGNRGSEEYGSGDHARTRLPPERPAKASS